MICPVCDCNAYDPERGCTECEKRAVVTSVTPKDGVELHIPRVVTPVTEVTNDTVTPVTPVTPDMVVRHSGFPPESGEVCPLCQEKKPSKDALKQREYRERKKQ